MLTVTAVFNSSKSEHRQTKQTKEQPPKSDINLVKQDIILIMLKSSLLQMDNIFVYLLKVANEI